MSSHSGAVGASEARLSHANVLAIAVPIILSNLTTPLIGVVDTAVLGRIDAPHLIGAVALGGTIFSFLYWMFAFLRMGTTGLTAQADGRGDAPQVLVVLARALLVALVAGVLLIALKGPIIDLALRLLGGSEAVQEGTRTYFAMRIWGAPAALINFALFGWLIGLGRARAAFGLQLLLNGLNMALAVVLGLWLGWAVMGVGLAAFLADLIAAIAGLVVAARGIAGRAALPSLGEVLDRAGLALMLAVNRDIMVRTLCVTFAFSYFTSRLADGGDVSLAANAILFQLVTVSAYLLDGFAFAAETLVGKAIGGGDRARFRQAVAISSGWAAACGLLVATGILLAGAAIVDLMSVSEAVRAEARRFLAWAALGPAIGVACYQLDGIFIGAIRTADMRNMMLLSLAVFMGLALSLPAVLGTHGLWVALNGFYLVRALTLASRLPALERAAFSSRAG